MKSLLALGALAALFQSTSCLEEGAYMIRPGGGVSSRALTDTGDVNAPLKFDIIRPLAASWLGGSLSEVVPDVVSNVVSDVVPGVIDKSVQRWFFTHKYHGDKYAMEAYPDLFFITSSLGYNISCGNQAGSPCVTGDQPQEAYSVRNTSYGTYQIVGEESGYFFRTLGEDGLQRAAGDGSIQEEFFLDMEPKSAY
ncbi:hypothetical protein BDV24DRAFT_166375 [Aspergillus arachidicola]|uniref:Uncharacterized protein n=1 Tax=Aspergillus arachidicola TaxID=656916 RepID=A0A2G7EMM0_9EURO|nr:hypothetical protein BDV24DRAFT_166375 [Aspergillus arachidicola]PIG69624.1 hypothetical protein AARAC_006634 [Aspergillus arachidicola]